MRSTLKSHPVSVSACMASSAPDIKNSHTRLPVLFHLMTALCNSMVNDFRQTMLQLRFDAVLCSWPLIERRR